MNNPGKIIIPDAANIWPHEIESAKALILHGYTVEFLPAANQKGRPSADCLLNGTEWEMKAPKTDNIKAIERNLKRGKWQSSRIIFDSYRMKRIPDKVIERELKKRFAEIKEIKQIKFINRRRQIIDIF